MQQSLPTVPSQLQQHQLNEQSFCEVMTGEAALPQHQNSPIKKDLNMFNQDAMLYGSQTADSNPFLMTQNANYAAPPLNSFDMTQVLLEDYRGFMRGSVMSSAKRYQGEQKNGLWNTHQDGRKSHDPGERSSATGNYEQNQDDMSSLTMNTNRLAQYEKKAETTEQKMQANLYKEFKKMKKYVEEPTGVTGTRVKTFSGHPSDILKASKDSTIKKLTPQHFSELKQNQIQVAKHTAIRAPSISVTKKVCSSQQRERVTKSALSQNKRVIPIILKDPYKPHEPSRENPRWVVPTSKRVRQGSSEPRQSSHSAYNAAARHSSAEPMSIQQLRYLAVRKTQAYFYRTTRSNQCGPFGGGSETDGQQSETDQVQLAIDNRNTINLQKVIDQYYDGDLPLDQMHNGDLHSIKMAQTNSAGFDVDNKHHNKVLEAKTGDESGRMKSRRGSTLVDEDTHREPNASALSSIASGSKVQTVFSKAKNQSQETSLQFDITGSAKNQLQGTKFKQSEMQGFRRVAHQTSQYKNEKFGAGSNESNNSSIKGQSFHGSNTIDSIDYANDEKKTNRKSAQNHMVDVGPLPNQNIDSRAKQHKELAPQMQQLERDLEKSTDTIGLQRMSVSAGYTSQILSRRNKSPEEDNSPIRNATRQAMYNNNKDLNQVIRTENNPQNYQSNYTLLEQNTQRSLTRGVISDKDHNYLNQESRCSSSRRDQSMHQEEDNSHNFGVSGERIKEQIRNPYQYNGSQPRYHKSITSNKLSSPQALIGSKIKNKIKDYNYLYNETLIDEKLGDIKACSRGSADLRTLSRGGDSTQFDLDRLTVDNTQNKMKECEVELNTAKKQPVKEDDLCSPPGIVNDQTFNEKGNNLISPMLQINLQKVNSNVTDSQPNVVKSSSSIKQEDGPDESDNKKQEQKIQKIQVHRLSKEASSSLEIEQQWDNRTTDVVKSALLPRNRPGSEDFQNQTPGERSGVVRALLSVSKQIVGTGASEINGEFVSERQESSLGGVSPGREKLQFLATAIYEKDKRLPDKESFADFAAEQRSRSMSEMADRPEFKVIKKTVQQLKDKKNSTNNSKYQSPGLREVSSQAKRSLFSNQKIEPTSFGAPEQSVSQKSKSIFSARKRSSVNVNSQNEQNNQPAQKKSQNHILFQVPEAGNQSNSSLGKQRNFAGSGANSPSVRNQLSTKSKQATPRQRVVTAKNYMKNGDRDYLGNDSSAQLRISAQETLCFDVKTEPGDGILKDKSDKQMGQFMDVNPFLHASASQSKDGRRETHDSEVGVKDFKLIESELGDNVEGFVNDDGGANNENEMTLKKSPIRVQTTTFNKTVNASLILSAAGDEIGNQSLALHETSRTDLSNNALGNTTYLTDEHMMSRIRPNTTSMDHRVMLPMSQVPIAPQNFAKSVSRVGNFMANKKMIGSNFEITSKQQQYGAGDPYISYLQNGEMSLGGNLLQQTRIGNIRTDFGSQTEMMAQTAHDQYQPASLKSKSPNIQKNYRRPKTSMHSFNQIQREIKQAREDRGVSQLLKRNISMNRRKQQLLLKGQIERQKRKENLASAMSIQDQQRPTSVITVPPQKRVSTANFDALEDDSKMCMIYSQKNRNDSLNLTGYSTHPLPGCEQPMQTIFGQEIVTPDVEISNVHPLQRNKFRQRRQSHIITNHQKHRLQLQKEIGVGATVTKSIKSGTNPAVIVLRAQESVQSADNHMNIDAKAMIQVDDSSPSMTAKITLLSPKGSKDTTVFQAEMVAAGVGKQIKENSVVSKVTVSQSCTRQSEKRRSSNSMQAIREVQNLISHQLSTDREREYVDYIMPRSPTTKEIIIHAAMQGQPAQGVGQEIQRKRERMKELYKQGRRKPVGLNRYGQMRQYSVQGMHIMERPTTTGYTDRRAASVLLDSSLGINASQSSFSVQGSSLKNQRVSGNPYIPNTQHYGQLSRLMKSSK